MYEERTGTPIDQIVILVVTEDGEVQEFTKQRDYLPLLKESIDTFNLIMNLPWTNGFSEDLKKVNKEKKWNLGNIMWTLR